MATIEPCPICGWGPETTRPHHPNCTYPGSRLEAAHRFREAVIGFVLGVGDAWGEPFERFWRRILRRPTRGALEP